MNFLINALARRAFMEASPESDDRILGFAMIGPEAGEVIAAVQTAMLGEAPVFGSPRRHSRAPDDGRGTRPASLQRAVRVRENQKGTIMALSKAGESHPHEPVTLGMRLESVGSMVFRYG